MSENGFMGSQFYRITANLETTLVAWHRDALQRNGFELFNSQKPR